MFRLLLISILAGGQVGFPPVPTKPVPAERIEGLSGLTNLALVAPGIYRGGMPGQGGMEALANLKVRTIVNLRHYHKRTERADAKKAGINYIWLPIPSSGEPSKETLEKFLAIVQDPSAQPVFVHCYRGKDRTGAMIAAYRVLVEGWTKQEAFAEMQEFGFFDGWVRLRRWVGRLEEKPR